MPQRCRRRSSIAILIVLATTVFLVLGSGGPAGRAVAQMGQGRDPMTTPSDRPAQSPPATQAPSNAPPQSGATAPFDLRDPEVIREGSVLFSTACTICHKRTESASTPGAAPTLRDTAYEKDYLFKMISEGPPSRRMPAWKFQYSPEQIWKLVAYILTFKGVQSQ
jgi:mono/diheme cytochrome c family protein